MEILKELADNHLWQEFYDYKVEKGHLRKEDEEYLRDFIEEEKYLPLVNKILLEHYSLEYPCKKIINKTGVQKKGSCTLLIKKKI